MKDKILGIRKDGTPIYSTSADIKKIKKEQNGTRVEQRPGK